MYSEGGSSRSRHGTLVVVAAAVAAAGQDFLFRQAVQGYVLALVRQEAKVVREMEFLYILTLKANCPSSRQAKSLISIQDTF